MAKTKTARLLDKYLQTVVIDGRILIADVTNVTLSRNNMTMFGRVKKRGIDKVEIMRLEGDHAWRVIPPNYRK